MVGPSHSSITPGARLVQKSIDASTVAVLPPTIAVMETTRNTAAVGSDSSSWSSSALSGRPPAIRLKVHAILASSARSARARLRAIVAIGSSERPLTRRRPFSFDTSVRVIPMARAACAALPTAPSTSSTSMIEGRTSWYGLGPATPERRTWRGDVQAARTAASTARVSIRTGRLSHASSRGTTTPRATSTSPPPRAGRLAMSGLCGKR